MLRFALSALLTTEIAGWDASSMLQMPVVVDKTLDTDNCRCPGYYQNQCEAEAAQGCFWYDAGDSNSPWCQCGHVPASVCCEAMTASCLSCQASISEDEYCARNPGLHGCPEGRVCCQAMTASCLACQEGIHPDEYCALNPQTDGCEGGPSTGGGRPILRKGWNLGNTLERTSSSGWESQPRAEWIFESVKEKGFDWVRIPVHWGSHADTSGNVDQDWMLQVEETVEWANRQGLVALINAHHEDWFEAGGDLNRLENIWRQIAGHFASYSDANLVFEIFNEPDHMSLDRLNQMNAAVLPVIRQSNPTRLVFLGGLAQMGRWWINNNPDAMHIPQGDENLGLTVHSYDPWAFAGDQPTLFTFSDNDAANADYQQGELMDWAQQRGVKEVVLNEFGVTNHQTNRHDRLKYYNANSQACASRGQGYAIWDDNGWWQVFNRDNRTWDEEVLRQLASFAETEA